MSNDVDGYQRVKQEVCVECAKRIIEIEALRLGIEKFEINIRLNQEKVVRNDYLGKREPLMALISNVQRWVSSLIVF